MMTQKTTDERNKQKERSLFLDSGAFSASTQGITIDIHKYITFVQQNIDVLDVYANLDVIGDPEATLKNQKIMESVGLSPLPCFHYGEPVKYLQYYIQNYDYIGLGGLVGIKRSDLSFWLDLLFSKYICDERGYPKVKVHGFGISSVMIILRYPWYSVDTTSWHLIGRVGRLYIPRFYRGKYDYLKNSWRIMIAQKSILVKEKGRHFKTLSAMEQKVVLDYIHSKGFTMGSSEFRLESEKYELKENERWVGMKTVDGKREVERIIEPGLSNQVMQRYELNAIYFLDLERELNIHKPYPWPFEAKKYRQGFDL
jgi:hypothetical protein